MAINQETYDKAKKINAAIQEYFKLTNDKSVRSTQIYYHLIKPQYMDLIQKDAEQGYYFRKFLKKLLKENLIHLIPQCKWQPASSGQIEWHFYNISDEKAKLPFLSNTAKRATVSHRPVTSKEEIDRLIELATHAIEKLPKLDASNLTYQQLATRKNYPRAYERWTSREIDILLRAYKKFGRIDKVAELLKRQPSSVERRLDEEKGRL